MGGDIISVSGLMLGVRCGVSEAGMFLLVRDIQVNFASTQLPLYMVYISNISFLEIKCLIHLVLVPNTCITRALAAQNSNVERTLSTLSQPRCAHWAQEWFYSGPKDKCRWYFKVCRDRFISYNFQFIINFE